MAFETFTANAGPDLGLDGSSSVTPTDFTVQPAYLYAADNHNVASGNGSWFSNVTNAVESLRNAPKFMGLAIGSGAVGIVNSGIAVANWFNDEQSKITEINYGKWVQEYDSDLGKYYRENADSIDTVGFIATSLVPGTLGVKALNMGQRALVTAREAGMLGRNMTFATNLLTPRAEGYIARAASELAATNQRFRFLQADTVKAIGSGFGQNALEAAAFETAVLATSFKSPFLQDMEAGDIAFNTLVGIGLGGAIGGVLAIPGIRSQIKSRTIELDKAGRQAIEQTALPSALSSDMHGAQAFLNREAVETYIAKAEAGLQPGQALPDGLTKDIVDNNLANARNTIRDINNQIRVRIQELTPNKAVANEFADVLIAAPSRVGTNMILGAEEFLRIGDMAAPSLVQRVLGNQRALDLATTGTNTADNRILWNKTWGSGAGKTFDDVPNFAPLADSVKTKKGQSIKEAVDKVTKSFGHRAKEQIDALGKDTSLAQIQSRYLWAGKQNLENIDSIKQTDIPLLERAFQVSDSGTPRVFSITDDTGEVIETVSTKGEIFNAITRIKDDQIARGIREGKTIDELAERLNVHPDYVTGIRVSQNPVDNYFYRQSQAEALKLTDPEAIFYKPAYMGIRQGDNAGKLNELQLDAELFLAAERKAAQTTIDTAAESAARYLGQGDLVDNATGGRMLSNYTAALPEVEVISQALTDASRFGAGARLFTFSNGNYGSLESMMQQIGAVKRKMDVEGARIVEENLGSAVELLRGNRQVAAEYATTRELIARTGDQYVPVDGRLVNSKVRDWQMSDGSGAAPVLREGVPESIELTVPGTYDVWAAHARMNAIRNEGRRTLRASQGLEDSRVLDSAYAIKPDPNNTPYFAFVVDPTLTGAGKTTMIHARTSDELEQMIRKIGSDAPEFRIIRKDQSEDYHKALGDFTYDKTLNDNHIDSMLASRGIMSNALPRTDGDFLANELLNWHRSQTRNYNADIISTKYEVPFRELEAMGKNFEGVNASKYPDMNSIAFNVKRNPYTEYTKLALNVSNLSEYSMLVGVNQSLDNAVSSVWNSATAKLREMRGVNQATLDEVNGIFAQHGFKTSYANAAEYLLANHPAGKGQLSAFIRGANSLLATTFLRLDWLNALNNKIGSTILTSTELRHLTSQIARGNEETVGKLAGLQSKIPGTDKSILSASRMQMKAYQNFWTKPELLERYREAGWVTDAAGQIKSFAEDLTLQGAETGVQLGKKMQAAAEKARALTNFGETITGNRLVEEMNRFVSADIMRQVTDIAVEGGIISAKEANSYINTFVNRTQVNLNASQRPLAFQGPIGMAMGLFQSYQFNLMQQLFRYVTPGSRKDAAFLMGMQGSFYGMNGLPGFQAFNEHIIGQAAGNHENRDITGLFQDAAGYDLSNFFLYGMPSNLLRANLYVRGDLTPQHPTILPSTIGELPFISMYSRALGTIMNTASQLGAGAPVGETILQGIEHNSMNRPLAGLAQTLRGLRNGNVYSTDRNGNILSSNDLFHISTLARLAGGRPLDESVARDQYYRSQMYQRAAAERRQSVARTLRASLIDDGTPSDDVMENVFNTYLETGGKSNNFNAWFMQQYMTANVSQAEKMRNALGSPYSQRMQVLIGGAESGGVNFSLLN